jgi:hypothetical protein
VASGALRQYSAGDLEEIAAALLRARFPGGVPIPVDIDYLVETQAGVTLDVMRGLRDTHGVAGAVLTHPEENRVTVLIDEAVADGLPAFYRFTLAEEFAHVVLHRETIQGITTLEQVVALHQSPDYYGVLDRNAKRFAAAVLMPAERLRPDARTLFAQLRAVNLGMNALTATLTVRLAQQYSVSTVAMRHRLKEWPVRVMGAIVEAFKRGLPTLP